VAAKANGSATIRIACPRETVGFDTKEQPRRLQAGLPNADIGSWRYPNSAFLQLVVIAPHQVQSAILDAATVNPNIGAKTATWRSCFA
jgi:hypothetical protein